MKNACLFSVTLVGLALAAACGGSASGPNPVADGGIPGSSSSSGGGSTSSGGTNDSGSGGTPAEGGMGGCQCASSEVCCVTGGAGGGGMGGRARTFSCAATTNACPTGALAVACTSAGACGTGQQCCYLPSANAPSATNVTECASSCPAGARQTCATNADCATGGTCEPQSGGVYGFMTCRVAPPCMSTADCAMGQVCCAGAAGAANSCQTGTTCPAGLPQICGPGDCAMGQVCCTSPADGGGASSCQSGMACPGGTTLICAATADCTGGMVCCEGGGQTCQLPSACGTPGNREVCATSADCPPAFPLCRNMTCRASPDGGAPGDDGGPTDAATGG